MRLKGMDLYEILNEPEVMIIEKVRKAIEPYCLFAPEGEDIAIYLEEQYPIILETIRKEADALGIKPRIKGNFGNLENHLIGNGIDWNGLVMDGYMLDRNLVWKEAVKIIKSCEERLIEAESFSAEWFAIQKEAIKVVFEKEIERRQKELDEERKSLIKAWMNFNMTSAGYRF